MEEIQLAIKLKTSKNAPGLPGISTEMLKAQDQYGVDWLYTILNDFGK